MKQSLPTPRVGAPAGKPVGDETDFAPLPAGVELLVPERPVPERFDDPEVWELIASGNARAVHHIESPAMISLSQMTNVRDIDTLVALVSVIRPGAANEDKKREFTRRYQGLSPVTYPHPSLESCLRSTFGLVVYEEHILQICEAFAGLPAGRADVLRRSLVKEDWPVVREIQAEFAECARRRGRLEEEVARVWEAVVGFHGYAFCKAHSTAYAVEAYQSAWLKRHFPAEFLAAVLTNGKGFYRPLVYVLEAWRLGVPMRPPDVNAPGPRFAVVEDTTAEGGRRWAIRAPATRVGTLTEKTRDRLLAERARGRFESLSDFYLRVQPGRDELEALSRAGALDGFGRTRCEQFWEIQQVVARWGGAATAGQGWLLPPDGTLPDEGRVARSEAVAAGNSRREEAAAPARWVEPSRWQRLQWEMELLGFPVSGHPLELFPDVAWDTYCPVSRLGSFVGEQVTLCGLVIEDRVHHQVTGEPMKFLTLCDWTGMVETELFAATYKSHGLATVRYPVLEVSGRVEPYENGRGHSLRVLRAGAPRRRD